MSPRRRQAHGPAHLPKSPTRKVNYGDLLSTASPTRSARTFRPGTGSERSRSAERALRQAALRRDTYLGPEAQKEAQTHIREEMAPSPPPESIQADREYRRVQQLAQVMYAAKVKEYPELAGVKKKALEEKRAKRGSGLSIEKKATEGVPKETITDDRGKEIAFKRPDGNRLRKVCPAFADGMTASFQPTKVKLKKKIKATDTSAEISIVEASPKESDRGGRLPGQAEVFEGRPIFREHFHEIVPGESEDE